MIAALTDELVARGHDVTLYASGDSATQARLISCSETGLRLDPHREGNGPGRDPVALHLVLLEQVGRDARDYDLIHSHLDVLALPFARRWPIPTISTLHGRLDGADLLPLFAEYQTAPVVSISASQRRPLRWLNWVATIHHGLPCEHLALSETRGSYLAFLGRICPEKGVEEAITIARRVGMPLKIAAKIDAADREYYEARVKHLIDGDRVEHIGEIREPDKSEFLGGAAALLFPIAWPEPFGLVMIESLACGTPVLGFRHGSVPEVLSDPASGAVVGSVEEAVAALPSVIELDRRACRAVFDRRFSVARMTSDYEALYRRILGMGDEPAVRRTNLLDAVRGQHAR